MQCDDIVLEHRKNQWETQTACGLVLITGSGVICKLIGGSGYFKANGSLAKLVPRSS